MSDSPTHPRAKRQKLDKKGRFAALERLKGLKGSKNKYEISDAVDNVYDEVDEKEYSKRVLARADDDWIEDDGTGYIEDGREIFDDEEYSEETNSKNKSTVGKNSTKKESKKRLRDITKPMAQDEKGTIRNIFSKMNNSAGHSSIGGGGGGSSSSSNRNISSLSREKDSNVKLDEDDVLADILCDLSDVNKSSGKSNTSSSEILSSSSKTVLNERVTERNETKEYLRNLKLNTSRKLTSTNDGFNNSNNQCIDDDDLVNQLIRKDKKRQYTTAGENEQDYVRTKQEPSLDLHDTVNFFDFTTSDMKNEKQEILDGSTNNFTDHVSTAVIEKDVKQDLDKDKVPITDDDKIDLNDDYNKMDFSILDDLNNQFNDDILIDNENNNNKSLTSNLDIDNFDQLLSNWESICTKTDDNNINGGGTVVAAEDDNDERIAKEIDETNEIKMWLWDVYEDNSKRSGELFLFGKYLTNTSDESKSIPSSSNNNDYKSICVKIQNVEKCLYLLPRIYMLDSITKEQTKQLVNITDVFNEFNDVIAQQLKIKQFRSKKVTKNFAFKVPNVDVPASGEYLQVRYAGNLPSPDATAKYNSIAYIFGTNTTALETFLLESQIKGPCWLNVKNFHHNKIAFSWCKLDLVCPDIKSVAIANERYSMPPPLVIISVNVRTAFNAKTTTNEIVMISLLVNTKFPIDKSISSTKQTLFHQHYCGVTRPTNQSWPLNINAKLNLYKGTKIIKSESERALLNWFLATVHNINPDLFVTHDVNDCQLDVLIDRCFFLKLPMWSRIGRLKLTAWPFSKRLKSICIGRMICDIKLSAEELNLKLRSYDLHSLCRSILKMNDDERMDISNEELLSLYESADGIMKLIILTMHDCSYILKIMCELNILPLALQITTICGNLMNQTLQSGRAARNDFLLLHAFTERNYIAPERVIVSRQYPQKNVKGVKNVMDDTAAMSTIGGGQPGQQAQQNKKKSTYLGGLVLDPMVGFYETHVLLMDFNSLYPSIIQEFNLCFTTVTEPYQSDVIPALPDPSMEQGILPRQIRQLVERRREVKKLMQQNDIDVEQKMQLNIRQMALKLTANSMYGCLGSHISRFYAQHLAAMITQKGREILLNTKALVEKMHYVVIYGDTDSIMINTNLTNYDQVLKIGTNIKLAINKMYRNIELDVDGVFKSLLLLKKKKYAAITIEKKLKKNSGAAVGAGDGIVVEYAYHKEIKGLDIVRRDWSQIAIQVGNLTLDALLSDVPLEDRIDTIHAQLELCQKNFHDNIIPLALLTINKQLTKQLNEYSNNNALPHVQVASRMNATRNKRYKKGDMVSYIICVDGTRNAPLQRAYHLDELKQSINDGDDKLKIDIDYYLSNQIHPVVSRLIAPINGTDAVHIAICLGLDPAKFLGPVTRNFEQSNDDGGVGESIQKSIFEIFNDCKRFTFKCISCKSENLIASPFKKIDNQMIPTLQMCSNKECPIAPYQYAIKIKNDLILDIRKCIKRYYENWLVCDNPSCKSNSRNFSHVVTDGSICLYCRNGFLLKQYTECNLYDQLMYYQYVFNLGNHQLKSIVKISPDIEITYNLLKETVDSFLATSKYNTVSLKQLFGKMITIKAP